MKLGSKIVAMGAASFLVVTCSFAPFCVFAEDAVVTEAANEVTETATQVDPESDEASGGALANSFRYQDGVLVGSGSESDSDSASSDSGISLFSLSTCSVPNTWQKKGSNYVVVNGLNQGMQVSGAKGFGIDVSHHQGAINWSAVKSSGLVDYAIIRCGWGSDYTSQDDTQFINNVRGCLQNGIPFGVYLYSYAYNTSMAQSEANHVLRMLSAAGLSPSQVTYPIYYDLENEAKTGRPAGEEGGAVVPISNATLEAMAQTFCATIENAGYRPGVYANRNWWNNYLTGSSFNQWSKWVAEYDYSCTYKGHYDMWQCMSDGTLPGISTNVDINFDFVGLENAYADQTTWKRVYGAEHLATMRAISQTGWTHAETVVIATNITFHDALAASALAGLYDCPVLVTNPSGLASQTKSEIARLGASRAIVVGGPDAISTSVDAQIRAAGCTTVERVYGANGQATARAIAEKVRQAGGSSQTCVIATAETFQDALSISPYAWWAKAPVYLTEFGSNSLSSETVEAIRKSGYTNAVIVGGAAAVNSNVESSLKSIGLSSVVRLSGATAYETSTAIAKWELGQGMSVTNMAVATGLEYYDALAGGALCGKKGSVLLLVCDYNRSCLTDFVPTQKGKVSTGYVFGGPAAVSDQSLLVLLRNYFG